MSAPNPVLSAAAPTLITVLTEFEAMIATITSGDPALIAARVAPAAQIFLGQLMLAVPALEGAGLSALNAEISTKVGDLIAKLKALT
jgi:hypothetical protein